MCGITGAVWTDPRKSLSSEQLERMTTALRHRGPDDAGSYRTDYRLRPPYEPLPGVGFGFRRLSIIDLASGHQPMCNEDETVWIVFNGEIYNFATLRRRLEGAGHQFRTHSDTETIVHLYEDVGLDVFSHLNGMFAIAIWDARQRRLCLARDRLGKKPLVYRHEPGRLLFASELKSLLELSDVPRELNPAAIDAYLTYQYVPHPKTIFQGLHKLPPGHLAVYQDDQLEVRRYWSPDWNHQEPYRESFAIERVRELLDDAVRIRLQSDVPLGAFLSGGIDSSLVVALMQRHMSQPVKTFSIGFPVEEYDETRFARQVASHLGTDHHEFIVTPDAIRVLPELAWSYDEPFADSSAVPTWYVSRQTRQQVTVALSGDGGDELFAGYLRYRAVWLSSRLDGWDPLRKLLALPVWQRLPGSKAKSFLRRFKRLSDSLGKSPPRRYVEWVGIFNEPWRARLYRDEFVRQLPETDPVEFLVEAWQAASRRDPVTAASLTDLVTYLPCDLMTKVDIASMAHSLEVRQPFLDYRLVEFAASLPIELKFQWGQGKRLLRQAFGDLLPESIWKRPKMGFGVPIDRWFRHELRELTHDVLLDASAQNREFFRPEVVQEMVQQHETGQADHAYRLWTLLMFELWLRRWSGHAVGKSEQDR